MMDLVLAAIVALGSALTDGSIQGTIRSDRNEPVTGVRIEMPARNLITWSDSTGSYSIQGLEPGTYEIRFSRFAFEPLILTIAVPARGGVELDVLLRTRFVTVPEVSVVTARRTASAAARLQPDGLPEVGSRELLAERMWSSPLAPHPDVLEPLRHIPGIDMAEERPTQIHVRGGSADQNLILLDGAPVYNGNHTSGVLGGLMPDAVSRLLVHTGVFPARYGGRLSSVIDVETRTPGRDGVRVRGGAGVPDVRMSVEMPLPRDRGGWMLGGRRTAYDLTRLGHFAGIESSGFEDIVGKAWIDLLEGKLEVVSLHTQNWLSSNAGQAGGPVAGAVPSGGDLDAHNTVFWFTDTDAVSWARTTNESREVRFGLWRAATHSNVEWGSRQDRHRMVNDLAHWGVTGDLAWTAASSVGRAGIAVEWVSTTYETLEAAVSGGPHIRSTFGARPRVISTYLEHRWIPTDHWLISNGIRAVHIEGHGPALEPRVSAHYRPSGGLTLSSGFGRVHQYVQSLTNEESLLNAAYSVDAFVAAGPEGTPVSRSDQVTGGLEARLTERLILTLDAYARWLDDIVLVGPVTPQPFAVRGFERGSGRARGLGAALAYRGDRADAEAILEWSRVSRSSDADRYHPRFERSRSLALAASYRIMARTTVRGAFQAAAGLPTSPLESGFNWEVFDQLTGEVEFSGTPLRTPGALNADRLPSYVRLDLGIRKDWRYPGPGPEGTITTYLDVLNVFSHENVLGRQLTAGGAGPQDLSLLPMSVLFGIEWSF